MSVRNEGKGVLWQFLKGKHQNQGVICVGRMMRSLLLEAENVLIVALESVRIMCVQVAGTIEDELSLKSRPAVRLAIV